MSAVVVVSTSIYSDTVIYKVLRGKTTYWIQCSSGLPPYVSQRYVSRLGRYGERRLPDGKMRDNLLAALQTHKTSAVGNV